MTLRPDFPIEPERYELLTEAADRLEIDRREFFRIAGCGVVVLLGAGAAAGQESGRRGGGAVPQEIGAWLHVGEDGIVTVFTGKTEVGQNIRTSLTQAVAEELRAPIASIRLVMADTDRTPYDQGTFGSRTTPTMAAQLRKVAAAARELLVDRAAARWKLDAAPRARLVASEGKIEDPAAKRSLTFGELTRGEKIVQTIAADVQTAPPSRWTVAGRTVRKIDGRAMVTGQHRYASDVCRDAQLSAKVLRPPSYGAVLESADLEAARATGATVVREGAFVGVAASSAEKAEQALAALGAKWKEEPHTVSSRNLFEHLKTSTERRASVGGARGSGPQVRGSIEKGMAASDTKLEATYTVAYIAHVPLEPRAAVAEWSGDKLTVWTGTQRPFGVRSELAGALGVSEANVRVIVPDTGSGYGGKHNGEAAIEAARLARAAGRPVKLVWTRQEEFAWAYFRPAGVIEVRAGARTDGTITAWEFHNYNSGGSAIAPLYTIPNQRIEFHPSRSPLRQGSYRGLAATANHFARESHVDELARMLKIDPLEFRLRNLSDARLRAVLEEAARRFGWASRKTAPGRGFGIAGGFEKGSYVATAAEVSISKGAVRVERVVAAFECGAIVNPDHLRSQVEGSVVQGLGGALFEAIEFEGGKLSNGRLSGYRVPRFSDLPPIEVALLDRKDLPPAGAGETPIVGIAPALGNAIFDASGIRLRSLPMVPNGLKL